MNRFLPLFFFCLGAAVMAQEPVPQPMEPALSEVFPVVGSPEGVRMGATVIMGEGILLEKGTLLRTIYAKPLVQDRDVQVVKSKKQMEDSFTRNNKLAKPEDAMSPKDRALYERSKNTVWVEPSLFLEALKNTHTQALTLSVVDPKSNEIIGVPLRFYEGMLVAESPRGLTVLSVDTKERAAQIGIRAGDLIGSVQGEPTGGSAATFISLMEKAQRKSGTSRVEIKIGLQRGDTPVEVCIKGSVSLNNSFF
ncbi:MAG: hypothetical protein SFY92_06240 [Verrucomicrobiae bacterium]|nr:hypothetical protein [Verrucomicrobiae bacterium]